MSEERWDKYFGIDKTQKRWVRARTQMQKSLSKWIILTICHFILSVCIGWYCVSNGIFDIILYENVNFSGSSIIWLGVLEGYIVYFIIAFTIVPMLYAIDKIKKDIDKCTRVVYLCALDKKNIK